MTLTPKENKRFISIMLAERDILNSYKMYLSRVKELDPLWSRLIDEELL